MGYGNSDIVADIYVSKISSKYGIDAPVVHVDGILNPDNINCNGNLEAFSGSFVSLTVNGNRIDGSQNLPSSTLKLLRTA